MQAQCQIKINANRALEEKGARRPSCYLYSYELLGQTSAQKKNFRHTGSAKRKGKEEEHVEAFDG